MTTREIPWERRRPRMSTTCVLAEALDRADLHDKCCDGAAQRCTCSHHLRERIA